MKFYWKVIAIANWPRLRLRKIGKRYRRMLLQGVMCVTAGFFLRMPLHNPVTPLNEDSLIMHVLHDPAVERVVEKQYEEIKLSHNVRIYLFFIYVEKMPAVPVKKKKHSAVISGGL